VGRRGNGQTAERVANRVVHGVAGSIPMLIGADAFES
jgi:hypothetical protein